MEERTGRMATIRAAPTLTLYQQCLFEAFAELSTDRAIGMEEGPIPWTSIRVYAHEYGYPLSDLSDIIRQMDGVYLEIAREKAGQRRGPSK